MNDNAAVWDGRASKENFLQHWTLSLAIYQPQCTLFLFYAARSTIPVLPPLSPSFRSVSPDPGAQSMLESLVARTAGPSHSMDREHLEDSSDESSGSEWSAGIADVRRRLRKRAPSRRQGAATLPKVASGAAKKQQSLKRLNKVENAAGAPLDAELCHPHFMQTVGFLLLHASAHGRHWPALQGGCRNEHGLQQFTIC